MVHLVYIYLTRIQFEYDSSRDERSGWCHLSIIPGTTPLFLVSTMECQLFRDEEPTLACSFDA